MIPMVIAVDFDGTIVEHRFPEIGRERPFAIDTLKALQKKGFRLILWTHRSGDLLRDAVEYCRAKELEFYCVNKNFPEEQWDTEESRKITADIYIDDRNLGGLPSWGEIYRIICPEEDKTAMKKSSWWKRQ